MTPSAPIPSIVVACALVVAGCDDGGSSTAQTPSGEDNAATSAAATTAQSPNENAAAPAGEFPFRSKYKDVEVVSLEDLAARRGEFIVVDVRAELEFNVVHIKDAVHKPIARRDFVDSVAALRAKDAEQPVAFYCNGHTCEKSYQAARKAKEAGFQNVFAYDAGIFDWVRAHPDKSVLLDSSPADLGKLIPASAFEAKSLSHADFVAKMKGPNVMVIDMREPMQRKTMPKLPEGVTVVNKYSIALVRALQGESLKGKELLIFDAVGKQVRWLQYHLENGGHENYWFLRGGVAASPSVTR